MMPIIALLVVVAILAFVLLRWQQLALMPWGKRMMIVFPLLAVVLILSVVVGQ